MVIPHYAAQEPGQGVRAEKPLSPRGIALPKALRPTAEDNLRSYQAWLAERESTERPGRERSASVSDENKVIPLANRRALRKVKNDPAHQAAKQQPAPVVAAQIIGQRKCLVCTRPTGNTHTRYCPEHTGAYWRWLECSEPGCDIVGERRIPGQTVYRCPSHSNGRSVGTAGESSRGRGQGREQVRLLLAQRRAALAKEQARKPLPPRPPNNIGHYI